MIGRDKYKRPKNRIRGVISKIRNYKNNNISEKKEYYRTNLFEEISSIRQELQGRNHFEFFMWIKKLRSYILLGDETLFFSLGRTLLSPPEDKIYFSPSKKIKSVRKVTFEDELSWVADQIFPYSEQISDFRKQVDALNNMFWSGDLSKCEEELDRIESSFGISAWLIEIKISIKQLTGGIEQQKEYTQCVKDVWGNSYPSYLAFFCSIRNEEKSTIRIFREDVRQKIESHGFPKSVENYLKYKITNLFVPDKKFVGEILRIEQGQSIIDLYETTIDICQKIIKHGSLCQYKESISYLLDRFSSIDDFRLDKLRLALGEVPKRKLGLRDSECYDRKIIQKESIKEIVSSILMDKNSRYGASIGIEKILLLEIHNKIPDELPEPLRKVLFSIHDALQKGESFEKGRGAVEKFSNNFKAIYGAVAIGDYLNGILGTNILSPRYIYAFTLNSPAIGREDLVLSNRQYVAERVNSLRSKITYPSVTSLILNSAISFTHNEQVCGTNPFHIDLASIPIPIRGVVSAIRISLAMKQDNLSQAIQDISFEAACSPMGRNALPVEDIIGSLQWNDLTDLASPLDLAIFLDVLWRKTAKDIYGTYVRFALEDILQQGGFERPSTISIATKKEKEKYIYLLRYIAIPSVMDLTGIFDGTSDLINERISICNILKENDPDNFVLYSDEIYDIEKSLLIQEGLRIVDTSRINVDTAAITRWAEQKYKESFSRYKALVASGIGVATDFDELLRDLSRNKEIKGSFFVIDDNEADVLLLDMISAIRNEFLNNPEHGLEFFLGKRMRHGTISGHLRGPVENAKLITQRPKENSNYDENHFWLDSLTFDSSSNKRELSKAFNDFSRKYDGISLKLKDRYMHVKSKEHPLGMFDIIITDIVFNILRSSIKMDPSFDGFIFGCYQVFWALLEPSLLSLRDIISKDSADEAALLFDELQNAARTFAEHDENYQRLVLIIRQCASDVRGQFASMQEWLTRTEVESASRKFHLEEIVDIAIRSALKAHNSFEPELDVHINAKFVSSASLLVILSDIIFVIIDNVCRRSACGHKPRIFISCDYSSEDETLIITAINPVGKNVDKAEIESRLVNIRNRMEKGDITSGARQDQGSGLLKIASITQQSKRGDLKFGFDEDGNFRTEVTLVFIEDHNFTRSEGDENEKSFICGR